MDRDIVIHLVHGTWPRGVLRQFLPPELLPNPRQRYWFEKGSSFAESLAEQLGKRGRKVRFCSFLWSGRNSQLSREKAALDLQRHLRDALADHPTAWHYIVAHSHGGNVALLAVSDRRSRFPANLRGVISLATPFLTFLPLRGSAFEESVRLLPLVLPPIAVLGFGLVGLVTGQWSLMSLLKGVAFAIFFVPLTLTWLSLRRRQLAKRYLALRRRSSPKSARLIAILRTPGDEATFALAMPQLMNAIARVAWHLGLRPILRIADLLPRLVAVVLIGLTPLVALGILSLPTLWPRESLTWGLQLMVVVGLIPIGLLLASFVVLAPGALICAFALGPEMFVASFVQEIFVDSTPSGWRGSLECVIPERRHTFGGTLRHSIHASRRVRVRVGDCIQSDVQGAESPGFAVSRARPEGAEVERALDRAAGDP